MRRRSGMRNARLSAAWRFSHRLEQLLGSGAVDIRRNAHPKPPDRYGRTLARVLVDGEDVAF
jgi:hypothetical protein